MDIGKKIPVKSDRVASRIIDQEAVIVLLNKQETIVLNELGSRLWELIDGKNNIDKLAQIIASEFDITYAEALKDIVEFVEDLVQREAIVLN